MRRSDDMPTSFAPQWWRWIGLVTYPGSPSLCRHGHDIRYVDARRPLADADHNVAFVRRDQASPAMIQAMVSRNAAIEQSRQTRRWSARGGGS